VGFDARPSARRFVGAGAVRPGRERATRRPDRGRAGRPVAGSADPAGKLPAGARPGTRRERAPPRLDRL